MKFGLSLHRRFLTADYLRVAKQLGATHIVAHLVDYRVGMTSPSGEIMFPELVESEADRERLWSYEYLSQLKTTIQAAGLELAAIENLFPAEWSDILLDGPLREGQIERIKNHIVTLGQLGIPCLGYYFSQAGTCGFVEGPYARGGAESPAFSSTVEQKSIPRGMVWNKVYDPDLYVADGSRGWLRRATEAEVWERYIRFLEAVLPTAEAAGVQLAAHPDYPPVPEMRGTCHVLYSMDHFRRLFSAVPSRANRMQLSIAAMHLMKDGNVLEAIEQFRDRISLVVCFNVRGDRQRFSEEFPDQGDIDIFRVLSALKKTGFDGVVFSGHAPKMNAGAGAGDRSLLGQAYALGYLRAMSQLLAS